jgi:hypothetical protein
MSATQSRARDAGTTLALLPRGCHASACTARHRQLRQYAAGDFLRCGLLSAEGVGQPPARARSARHTRHDRVGARGVSAPRRRPRAFVRAFGPVLRLRRARQKAGGDWIKVTFTANADAQPAIESAEQALALEEALTKLEQTDERAARVVELRYFAGLSPEQVAEVLNVTRRTSTATGATHARSCTRHWNDVLTAALSALLQ